MSSCFLLLLPKPKLHVSEFLHLARAPLLSGDVKSLKRLLRRVAGSKSDALKSLCLNTFPSCPPLKMWKFLTARVLTASIFRACFEVAGYFCDVAVLDWLCHHRDSWYSKHDAVYFVICNVHFPDVTSVLEWAFDSHPRIAMLGSHLMMALENLNVAAVAFFLATEKFSFAGAPFNFFRNLPSSPVRGRAVLKLMHSRGHIDTWNAKQSIVYNRSPCWVIRVCTELFGWSPQCVSELADICTTPPIPGVRLTASEHWALRFAKRMVTRNIRVSRIWCCFLVHVLLRRAIVLFFCQPELLRRARAHHRRLFFTTEDRSDLGL